MLSKFKVSNFKSFNNNFSLDLSEANGYNFNSDCVKNKLVRTALVYGHNGVGKSNLGLAIFDIISHLTDRKKNENEYLHYLNGFNSSKYAEFYYEFIINSQKVTYEYRKSDYNTIISEKLTINDNVLASINRELSNKAEFNFEGTASLKNVIENNELSILKYIRNNSILDENIESKTFSMFFQFIEGMLFFRSLRYNMYLGIDPSRRNSLEEIIESNKVDEFELFLNNAGIECKLKVVDELEKKIIAFDFNGNYISFEKIASHGTWALTLFYFWFQKIKEGEVSFLFIDEFDAFYHHELSSFIVKELKNTNVQFILTTHNTSIITNDLLRPDCYYLMHKDNIKSLSKSSSKELREAHNIEKMYKAGAFNG